MGFRNMYISASAGSGKTYRLVNRFLALLCLQKLEKGIDVSRIIAITFTRKAAGEFRGRILSALAEGALSPDKADKLWNGRILPTINDRESGILPGREITLPCPPEDFFREALAEVMHQFPSLNLGTIDSLFQRMVSALAYELGLSHFENLRPEDERQAQRKALDSTYRLAGNTPDLGEAIMDSMKSESSLSMLDTYLQDLVHSYHSPALDSVPSAWGGETDALSDDELAAFGVTRKELTPGMGMEEYQEKVAQAKQVLEDFEGQRGIKKLQTYVQSLAAVNDKLEASKGKLGDAFRAACLDKGIDLADLEHARRAFLWQGLLKRTRALRQLLDAYESGYSRDVRSHGLFTFDDVPRLLTGHSDAETFASVQERTDARLEHWLLDEFQDTSGKQYSILRDLLESRAQGDSEGSVLMVGDAKQSIYQFRGGDPRLFIGARENLFGFAQGKTYPEGSEYSAELSLNESYRSAQAVLDLSNDLFCDIGRTARCATPKARLLWESLRYGVHRSAPGLDAKLGGGCAQVWMADKLSDDESGVPRDTNVYRSIAALLHRVKPAAEHRICSCAILVRTGKDGIRLAQALHELKKDFPFAGEPVVCDDKEVGHDSPLGQALMQLFRWLDNPADNLDWSMLRLTPLASALTKPGRCWQELNTALAAGGVSAVLAKLAPEVQQVLTENEFMHQRWKTWVDEAEAFDAEGGKLSDFLQRMENVTVREEPVGDVIRIMTIHKAKGLEFDVVILPVLSNAGYMADMGKVSLLSSKNEDGSPQALLLPPPRDKGFEPGMAAGHLVEEWQSDQEFAGFCELYVAVTRAKRATYIVQSHIDEKSVKDYLNPEKREGESVKGMLLQLATEFPPATPVEGLENAVCTYAVGHDTWWKNLPQDERPEEESIQTGETAAAEEFFSFATLERRTPSSMDRDREMVEPDERGGASERVLRLRDCGGTSFGSAVHALFEGIGWQEEGETPSLPPDADPRAAALVRRALETPAIARYFRHPAGDCRLYREQNVEAIYGGSWISGQIDRLVVHYEQGTPVRACIYDYKTDAEPDPAVLAANYHSQMEAYRRLVALAFNLPQSAVSVTLLHVSSVLPPEPIELDFD